MSKAQSKTRNKARNKIQSKIQAEQSPTDPREQARSLFYQGYKVAEIARKLGLAYATVNSWKGRDQWQKARTVEKTEFHLDQRLCLLIAKSEKSPSDLNEIDVLMRCLERTSRIKKYEASGKEGDLNPNIHKRNAGKKKKPKAKNFLSEENIKKLLAAFEADLFDYQIRWRDARDKYRIRNILKSRQIGATWFFAREALISAIETGDNQIFLSASKAQAHVFREYIVAWVEQVCDITLTGDPIKLWNGAHLYFLGTNSRTAQSYHGHLYVDEYFWIPRFSEFQKVASGMAVHKKWTQTYFSTPSTIGHEAYPFWTGEKLNKGKKKEDHIKIDVSHQNLAAGKLCEDGHWKQIVTIEDAVRGGCNLFNLIDLKREYSDQDYENLFMCIFVDDHVAFFKLNKLQACQVDSWDHWDDIDLFAPRPANDMDIWLGYDPSRFRDDSSIAIIAPPRVEGGKYRLIEKIKLNNMDFSSQAEEIRKLCQKYHVVHIGVDTSGIGQGVFELVQKFFPAVMGITYGVEVKNRLVLRADQLINHRKFEYDAGASDVTLSFMTIRKAATASGRQNTFQASRTSETGHADVAWAIMHALAAEGLTSIAANDDNNDTQSFLEIC